MKKLDYAKALNIKRILTRAILGGFSFLFIASSCFAGTYYKMSSENYDNLCIKIAALEYIGNGYKGHNFALPEPDMVKYHTLLDIKAQLEQCSTHSSFSEDCKISADKTDIELLGEKMEDRIKRVEEQISVILGENDLKEMRKLNKKDK